MMTLVRFSTPPAFALCPAAPGRRLGFSLPATGPKHRLTAVLAKSNHVVLGCGLVTLDYLATVDAYPRPDDKIRTGVLQVTRPFFSLVPSVEESRLAASLALSHGELSSSCSRRWRSVTTLFSVGAALQISGGGNAGNALTAATRLGLNTRLISKVGNDEFGATVLQELKEAGIDISHVIISDDGNTTFCYVIIDKQTKTRTCIITPAPSMVSSDLSLSSLSDALQDVNLLFLDGYSHEMAVAVARQADQVKIPILVDAEPERTKAELEGMLSLASYIVCSAKFPEKWTSIPSIPCALLEILLQYPRAKFVIVTLGENGCMMLERNQQGNDSRIDTADIENVTESLKLEVHKHDILPTCVSSKLMRLSGRGFGTLFGRLLLGTAENIPASEVVDTTGCGDAFIGAVLHGVSTEMPSEKMLPFACQVAAIKCRAIGARAGLPWQSDPRLAKFLG